MPGQRNPLTEGERIVTMRIAGPASVSAGGDTWTFSSVRNIRRIRRIVIEQAAAFGAGDVTYFPIVLVNDGQGNTRTVQVLMLTYNTMVWVEATGQNLSAINFIATLELAEGP